MELLTDLTELAVMWVMQVVVNIHKFWRLLRQADHYFREHRPDAVILIDYPGFNWWVARKAKKYGIPVFYYGAPQMWAWASFRVRKMRRLVDHVLCKLPFEARWYQERGCNAIYVGHPYFDQLTQQLSDLEFMHRYGSRERGRLVTILPGSRTQEVVNNLPWLLRAAAKVHRQSPKTRFAIASFNEKQAVMRARIGCQPGSADSGVRRSHVGVDSARSLLPRLLGFRLAGIDVPHETIGHSVLGESAHALPGQASRRSRQIHHAGQSAGL